MCSYFYVSRCKEKTSTSTDVDCTKEIEESLQDSSQLSKLSVKTHVQNLNNVSQISSDFEFASDENSEISFFSASSSVGEDVDAAL